MFCNKPLGTNEVLETFPVGRRLAFDAAKGRLWVVCRKCERWNLSPLEERWEAVESCEKLFRGTRVRVSSENVGLARHPEGLELVRIGKPQRPEFAAWRYGDQFGRRRRRYIAVTVGAGVVVAAVAVGGAVTGAISGAVLGQVGNFWNVVVNRRTLVKLRTDDGEPVKLKRPDLLGTRIRAADGAPGFKLQVRKRKQKQWFEGEEAQRFAGAILPRMNTAGGKRETVQQAVSQIEDRGHPERFLLDVADGNRWCDKHGVPGYVNKMPRSTKLALEMALHEEQERRAMTGELWLLEKAWRDAEEIAAISDDLFLPEGATEFVREKRREAGAVEPDAVSPQPSPRSQATDRPT